MTSFLRCRWTKGILPTKAPPKSISQTGIQARRKELAIEWMNIAGDCSERSVEIVSEDAVFESDAFPFLKTPQEYGKMMSQIVKALSLDQRSFVYPYPSFSDFAGRNSDHDPSKRQTKTQTTPDSVFTRERRNSDHGLSFWEGKTQTMI